MSNPTTELRAAPEAGPEEKPAPLRRRLVARGDGAWPWLFILPTVFGITVFYLWPIIQTFYYSFTKWGVFGGAKFIGLDNYVRLFSDSSIPQSLLNTIIYTLIVLMGIPIAVVLSALMESPGLKFAGFYRTLYFIPYITMPAAVGIVWRLVFNGDFGPINWFLSLLGIEGPYWTSTPGFALAAVATVGLWMSLGFNLIIIGAGLREIPQEIYEAAEMDGASRLRQFFSITVPLLTPSIFFVSVVTVISGFQLFDLLYVMMGKANLAMPQTQSLVYIFYNHAFLENDKGYAAAVGILILLIIAALTAVQFRVQRKWVNYV
ncbi:multiple sugar transport system permease protein [Arthrobacter sp. ov407]|uniref:carbohydrate ABC transporter permease n=1 Tax=Arthrobacter sp. ov407 TaxID=1761748 RepID=UPI00088C3805|nr:sugar ABC transporter permease [Arthrobacter sp. ov407]SDL19009.1 multiple sugar transport system permease protein [Arthrobacter sp. ov407]